MKARELGLDEYATPEAALAAIAGLRKSNDEKENRLGQKERELGTIRKELDSAPKPDLKPKVEPESFNQDIYDDLVSRNSLEAHKYISRFNPNTGMIDDIAALRKDADQSKADRDADLISQREERVLTTFRTFAKSKKDFASKEAEITRLLKEDPVLSQIMPYNPNWAIENAYMQVSQVQMPTNQETTQTNTISETKLKKASTSSGGNSRITKSRASDYTDAQLAAMPEKDLEKLYPVV